MHAEIPCNSFTVFSIATQSNGRACVDVILMLLINSTAQACCFHVLTFSAVAGKAHVCIHPSYHMLVHPKHCYCLSSLPLQYIPHVLNELVILSADMQRHVKRLE